MDRNKAITLLLDRAEQKELFLPEDRYYIANLLLCVLELDGYESDREYPSGQALDDGLHWLLDDACKRGVVDGSTSGREKLQSAILGCLTPRPSEVQRLFWEKYRNSPHEATDWFVDLCRDVGDIHIGRDRRWKVPTEYGELEISINLSKPEKDPLEVAVQARSAQTGYPKCRLCLENEGYAGRPGYPARQNHRVIPITLAGEPWGFQYSPYVYYNEHCIAMNAAHTPMKIDEHTFEKLFAFLKLFPHYFIGSNAELPIVGGSILGHEHYQGGRYSFAMERAPVETELQFPGYGEVYAGIVKWPVSVLRLRGAEEAPLIHLAGQILRAWRQYSDPSITLYAKTNGIYHNTVTPIARRRGEEFELDLVLRNNLTTQEFPLGLFHPHPEYHHIKRENIGLIEVMGLAILPSRLQGEMEALIDTVLTSGDLRARECTAKHADWMESILTGSSYKEAYSLEKLLKWEIGKVFLKVLENTGVFKRDGKGKQAFLRFASYAAQDR